jgi:hypothetical protein
LPIFGLRNEFVATRRDQLQAARRNSSFSPATFCPPSVYLAGQVGIV